MSYEYRQASGALSHEGVISLFGYAGKGPGRNNPGMQDQHGVGPIPQGWYTMTELVDSPHTGLATIILEPDPENEMYGRSAFRWHGDNAAHDASDGCIVAGHAADRIAAWDSGDHRLQVLA